jgi:hypothetical protein
VIAVEGLRRVGEKGRFQEKKVSKFQSFKVSKFFERLCGFGVRDRAEEQSALSLEPEA